MSTLASNGAGFERSRAILWTDRLIAFVLAAFSVWTVGTHINVVNTGYFGYQLYILAISGLAGLIASRAATRAWLTEVLPAETPIVAEPELRLLLVGLAIVLAGLFLILVFKSPITYVVACVTAICVLLVFNGAGHSAYSTNNTLVDKDGKQTALFLLSFLTIVIALYLFGHQIDGDEGFYLNMAIGAKEGLKPLLRTDTLMGDWDVPIQLQSYKIHSFELLSGTLSSITGVQTVAFQHFIVPIAFLVFFCAVLFRLYARLLGPLWPLCVLLHLAVMFVMSQSYASIGMHGVFRFYEGKGVLISALVPYIFYGAVRFMERGYWIDLAQLVMALISAAGLTANGIVVGPLALAVTVLACLLSTPSRKMLGRALLTGAAILYPVICGILVLIASANGNRTAAHYALSDGLWFFFGYNAIGFATMILFPLLWGLAREVRYRRLFGCLALASFAVVINPLAWSFLERATGGLTFRALWSIPYPVLMAYPVCSFLQARPRRNSAAAAATFAVLAVVGYLFQFYSIQWKWPGPRVSQPEYEVAQIAAGLVNRPETIWAPSPVAIWIPAVEPRGWPVAVRDDYFEFYGENLPLAKLRRFMLSVINGENFMNEVELEDALSALCVRVIVAANEIVTQFTSIIP